MGRAAKIAVAAISGLLLICATLYLARRPITAWLLERYLGQHGVESSIVIDRLSFSGLVARLRLGNPGAPDLTVERIGASIGWQGVEPHVTSIELYRPVLRMSFDGHAFSFGTLQKLMRPVPAHGASQPVELRLPSPQHSTAPAISGTGPQIAVCR